jgi:hypothetical protein
MNERPSALVQYHMSEVREGFAALRALVDRAIPECSDKWQAQTALDHAAGWALKALAVTDPRHAAREDVS